MHTFKIRVRHDKGETTLIVKSETMAKAIEQVLQAEGCPERAIILIKRIK